MRSCEGVPVLPFRATMGSEGISSYDGAIASSTRPLHSAEMGVATASTRGGASLTLLMTVRLSRGPVNPWSPEQMGIASLRPTPPLAMTGRMSFLRESCRGPWITRNDRIECVARVFSPIYGIFLPLPRLLDERPRVCYNIIAQIPWQSCLFGDLYGIQSRSAGQQRSLASQFDQPHFSLQLNVFDGAS
jgi:hypothetical protein